MQKYDSLGNLIWVYSQDRSGGDIGHVLINEGDNNNFTIMLRHDHLLEDGLYFSKHHFAGPFLSETIHDCCGTMHISDFISDQYGRLYVSLKSASVLSKGKYFMLDQHGNILLDQSQFTSYFQELARDQAQNVYFIGSLEGTEKF